MKYDIGLQYSAARASPRTMSQSDLAELCTVAGWVHDNAQAVCIIMAESSGQTGVTSANPDGNQNIGLFQIDTVNVQHGEYLKDPVYNANVARRMWIADGGSFAKRWATAPKCAGKTGNAPLADEATPIGPSLGGIGNQIANAISGILNSIPWFRLGKGAFGFILLVAGAGAMIFTVGNKASRTPVGRVAKKAIL